MDLSQFYHHILRRFCKESFEIWQNLGLHITPNHYYQPIPDTRRLQNSIWQEKNALRSININETKQINLLLTDFSQFQAEYEQLSKIKTNIPHQYFINNGSFESVDGEILYCMIRKFKPERIFEIGSGYSTYLSAQAVERNRLIDEKNCELIAFEPFPNDILKKGFPGLSKLVAKRVQDIPLSEFMRLRADDILFIDSSHVLKIGSDVQYEFLDIIPSLNEGVIIHIHDIFLPAEYPKDWIMNEHRFWNEQYFLQAFLSFNDSFEVLWAGSYMHLNHPHLLEVSFNSYNRKHVWPGSFWMKKIK